jgi:hypothetical protein
VALATSLVPSTAHLLRDDLATTIFTLEVDLTCNPANLAIDRAVNFLFTFTASKPLVLLVDDALPSFTLIVGEE